MPHIHNFIDFTVEVFIVHKNRVLLRYHDKYYKWLGVGGHIELNEDPNQAALREVYEETGLRVTLHAATLNNLKDANYKELVPPRFLNIHKISSTHKHIAMTYFAISKSDIIRPVAQDIGLKFKWVTTQELENINIEPNIKFYAISALKTIKAN